MIMFGLIIGQPHLNDILDGVVSGDRRAFSTRKRGRIALVDDTTGTVLGFADLTDVRKINYMQFLEQYGGHRVNADMWAQHRTYYEFVLKRVTRAKYPFTVDRSKGETVWVELPDDVETGRTQRSLFDFKDE